MIDRLKNSLKKIKVVCNSGKQEIKKENDYLKVYLKSSPEKGRANVELISLLASYFNSDVKIVKGKKSRNKVISIDK